MDDICEVLVVLVLCFFCAYDIDKYIKTRKWLFLAVCIFCFVTVINTIVMH